MGRFILDNDKRVVNSMFEILPSRRKLRGCYNVKKYTPCVHSINFLFVTSKALANKHAVTNMVLYI